jgi:hypothetical protein
VLKLTFDPTNPDGLRDALTEIESQMEHHRAAVQQATREYQRWADLQEKVMELAGALQALGEAGDTGESDAAPDEAVAPHREPAQARAVRIVKENNRPMVVGAVNEQMPDVKRKTVGWALWNAVREGELARLGQGLYAPPDFIQGQEPLVTSPNGADPAASEDD